MSAAPVMTSPARRSDPRQAELGAHALSIEQTLEAFRANVAGGLDDRQIAERRRLYGRNELAAAPQTPRWKRLLSQFKDLVIGVLIAAAVISAVCGQWIDAGVILAIVILNGLIGFMQEERAGRALSALRNMSRPQARVIRQHQISVIPASELVPGDRIEVEAGDHVPADARLIRSTALRVQEAALTGESSPVEKDHRSTYAPEAPLAERSNLLHMGTSVAAGKGQAVVVATGMKTQIGQIAGMLQAHEPEPTPLQRRLAGLGKILIAACLTIVAIIAALQWMSGRRLLDVLLPAVSLAVAAVPEGMPAVVTIALALGLQRMAKRNALVRRLPSVETLGSVTVICSDKTGTLTRNELTVREIHADGKRYDVTGAGYEPRGEFFCDSKPVAVRDEPDLRTALSIGAWCGYAELQCDGDGWKVIGDPTEGALIVAAAKGDVKLPDDRPEALFELPFDSDRKAMSIAFADGEGAILYTKGAVEVVLSKCTSEQARGETKPLTAQRRQEILQVNSEMSRRAMRVIALAYRCFERRAPGEYEESDLVFAGLAGMIDPPRDEVREAVQKCRAAGIRPVMITGDHPDTALAIARELGIASEQGHSLTGAQLDQINDAELKERVHGVSVYARVTAAHKLRIVRALKSRGEVVAMTGDGVNDAPAVQAADIGIAMGISGVDVTKEVSDMVLVDDHFATIVNAVEEGRGIFENIRKFVHYLLSSNASELIFVFVATLLGWPLPLLAVQILWINLVTDSLPALGLGTEPPEGDAMRRKPRPMSENFITLRQGGVMLCHALLMAGAALSAFALFYRHDPNRLTQARTAAFCVLSFAQLLYAMTCRSLVNPLFTLSFFGNPRLMAGIVLGFVLQIAVVSWPPARIIFRTDANAGVSGWMLIILLSTLPAGLIESWRMLRYRWRKS